jgi:predicted alpha/beta superfamily hydrolase
MLHPDATLVRVRYPLARGRLVLRAEPEWTHDIEASAVHAEDHCWEFELPAEREYRYFKPVALDTNTRWAVGANYLALRGQAALDVYPHFSTDERCSECELREIEDRRGRRRRYRVFYPPGYWENTLRRYPVLYMQDGQNLFFPGESLSGEHWRIADTLRILDSMNAIAQVIVVGVYPDDRENDYTQSGYEAYGRFLVDILKPEIDAQYRTLTDAANTVCMGSSLGGVVSLYLAWQHPEVFGAAACLSSTFGWRDDLAARIATERKRDIRVYLDSGWPQDNYEVTRSMRQALAVRGFEHGRDLHYYCFPQAAHHEAHWAMRAHLPFQLLFGAGV